MLQGVIFDMDGTLLDTEKLSVGAWQTAGRELGYEIPADFIVSYFGMGRDNIDRLYLERFGPDFPIAQVRSRRIAYGERYARENPIPVKPGAEEILRFLRSRGIPAALATSTDFDRAQFQLQKCGLWTLLDIIVTGDMVKNGKPAPDIYLEAVRKIGCAPFATLVIEDTENGARAGLAAGCRTVIVPDLREPGGEIRRQLLCVCATLADVIPVIEALQNS